MRQSGPIPIFQDRRILLGVCGSIAIYKSVDLASKLTQAGAQVDVILTQAAEKFVSSLAFQSVTGRRAHTEADLWGSESHLLHIGLAESADMMLIAPATANTIAKGAHGLADSLLTIAALAARCPILVAPAMDVGMYENPATQANVRILEDRGWEFVGPEEGRMASGLVGKGRMVEPERLMGVVRGVLGRKGPLAKRKVVVTAGGTLEPIDPVRAVCNHSSGRQGFALAQAAIDRGAEVVLIAASVKVSSPYGVELVEVRTAAEMRSAVSAAVEDADVLLMAAAVADFRPVQRVEEKIKRREGVPKIRLEPTDDILAHVAEMRHKTGRPTVVVGFAAESENLLENARAKLEEKQLSLIVANDITASDAGFAVDNNRVTLLDRDGGVEKLQLMPKSEVAEMVLERVVRLLP